MKRFIADTFRAAKQGFRDGMDPENAPADWQTDFDDLNKDLDNSSMTDQEIVERYFVFLSNYPEKRILENVRNFSDRMMRQREGTIPLIQAKIKIIKKQSISEE
jgi:hypothetical protein